MRLSRIDIHNFRKLKACRIDVSQKETIFVGANNSGKTTAISAIRWFLGYGEFKTKDFTLKHWDTINAIGKGWTEKDNLDAADYSMAKWEDVLPYMDVWIDIEWTEEENLAFVQDLFPTLESDAKRVGVRVRYEPENIGRLCDEFKKAFQNAQDIQEEEVVKMEIYPKNLRDFLDHENNLQKRFVRKFYLIDETNLTDEGVTVTDEHPLYRLDRDPLKILIRLDVITAEREFADQGSGMPSGLNRLSEQLHSYYVKHVAPNGNIDAKDLGLIRAIEDANRTYNERLAEGFKDAILELETMNYPGYMNPEIEVRSKLRPEEGIKHESAVQFKIDRENADAGIDESYNGLGYRNLISMYFRLIQFRKDWLKENKRRTTEREEPICPIHLVCIEEPEAHLHAQAQKVFVSMAYQRLTNGTPDDANHRTQLFISTHSSHVVQNTDFEHIRYFRRYVDENLKIPVSNVINMTDTFKTDKETKQFVARYIRLTHCDVFFADAIVMVEGAAERILMPIFLNNSGLSNKYISIVEIAGSHAHRFKDLVERLGILTLVVTDLDAQEQVDGGRKNKRAKKPQKGKGQTTNNDTLRTWLPKKESVDDLLNLASQDKVSNNVRVAYQKELKVQFKGHRAVSIIPYTFEDALAFANKDVFINKKIDQKGIIKKFNRAFEQDTAGKCRDELLSILYEEKGSKAQLAVDLLMWWNDIEKKLTTPNYISEGLEWLKDELQKNGENVN